MELAPVNPAILDHYISLFTQEEVPAVEHPEVCDQEELYGFHPEHSHWMLVQIKEGKLSSVTKEHRWLGFVQASMVLFGLMTITAQRDFTRNLLNGS